MAEDRPIYAVIDTNVLVSALLASSDRSNPMRVILAILSGKIIPMYNSEIISEYREVLSRKKFPFTSGQIYDLLNYFMTFGIDCQRIDVNDEVFPDKDDRVVYEVRMSVEGSYLVTGNLRHFPYKPYVVTPAQMLEILQVHE